MKLLITGGAGFIGSNFIRYMIRKYPHYQIVNLDNLTYAGNPDNLEDVKNHSNYYFIKGDISDSQLIDSVLSGQAGNRMDDPVDIVINFAAESHVDRSILHPDRFVRSNICGTQVLLDLALKYNLKKFIQISTDEVYGSIGQLGYFTEETPLAPNSPYSASKAGADLLVRAYNKTYDLPTNITRCSNNYGPYQFPEKLIPLVITHAIQDKELPVYGDGLHVRDWLHVEDHCSAIDSVLHRGKPGDVYNIGGNNEWTNIEIVKKILRILGKPDSLIQFVKDRPGHDRRYAIDSTKIQRELNWVPRHSFEEGIEQTVLWYLNNQEWWKRILSGEFRRSL
ncbi:dTDP-glucose 4,6-dehydratase [Ammoniphilus sp. 3BR4]|uniref:dTDP-glucose 4,6-dehydratase n=1 Tax=Ammoniphilus sp. 3BR4 TaxID=3158265 RepID=UPI0034674818